MESMDRILLILLSLTLCHAINNKRKDKFISRRCSFHRRLQGEYSIEDTSFTPQQKSSVREPLRYHTLFIGPTSIPEYGHCVENNNGDQYILEKEIASDRKCYRCLRVMLRTVNIVEIEAHDIEGCHATVEDARRSCFAPDDTRLMLWRNEYISQPCPFNGRASLSYSLEKYPRCAYPSSTPSTIDNCGASDRLDLKLQSCNFPSMQLQFQCLGVWPAPGSADEFYFGVFNTEAREYRCGRFRDLRSTEGYALAALSNDSSCHNMLQNATSGYEIFAFYPPQHTDEILNETPGCTFPGDLKGDWSDISFGDSNVTVSQPSSVISSKARCEKQIEKNLYLLQTVDHCGQSSGYYCMRITRLANSVIKITTSEVSTTVNDCQSLLSRDVHVTSHVNHVTSRIITRYPYESVPCPLQGTYASSYSPTALCHSFSSAKCERSHSMLHTRYMCEQPHRVFDTNQKQCLADFQHEGVRVFYTHNVDTRTFSCTEMRTGQDGSVLLIQRNPENCELPKDSVTAWLLQQIVLCRRSSPEAELLSSSESTTEQSLVVILVFISMVFVQ